MFSPRSSSSSFSSSSACAEKHLTIQQQPHDAADAARLYGQLQEKAEDKVEEIVIHQLKNIGVQFATMEATRNVLDFTTSFRVMAQINGRQVTVDVTFEDVERHGGDHVRAAMEKLSREITEAIMQQVMLQYLITTRTHRFR